MAKAATKTNVSVQKPVVRDKYQDYSKDDLIRLLRERDRKPKFGLVWERDEIDHDRSVNSDFVALDFVPELSCGDAPFQNLLIEGDNFDALRYSHPCETSHLQHGRHQALEYTTSRLQKMPPIRHPDYLFFLPARRLTACRPLPTLKATNPAKEF